MITIPILKEHGHILIETGGKRAVIDTGSATSMATEPFDFLGSIYSPPADIFGVTPRTMSELAGFQIDILIGCDILFTNTLRIRWNDGLLDAGNDIEDGPIVARMDVFMGVPVVPLTLRERPARALLDTGAYLSYIRSDLVDGQSPCGQRSDFHPIAGQFVATTFRVPTALDDMPLDIEYGILPDSLQGLMGLAMGMSGSSAVVGTQLLEYFDCTVSWRDNKISWKRA